jgi:DNA-binding transcriptional LysR family regulator
VSTLAALLAVGFFAFGSSWASQSYDDWIVTPTQRAFSAVVRLGSVKEAAGELGVTEAAVSLHIGHLRKELGDRLFTRTASGLAFTPGGLRLASRAAELLGLQDRTIQEISQAGRGRRLLRLAASTLFAEHAAPGLIELFAGRANDLDVELSVHHPPRVSCAARGARGRRRARPAAGRAARVDPADRIPELPHRRGCRCQPSGGSGTTASRAIA